VYHFFETNKLQNQTIKLLKKATDGGKEGRDDGDSGEEGEGPKEKKQ